MTYTCTNFSVSICELSSVSKELLTSVKIYIIVPALKLFEVGDCFKKEAATLNKKIAQVWVPSLRRRFAVKQRF